MLTDHITSVALKPVKHSFADHADNTDTTQVFKSHLILSHNAETPFTPFPHAINSNF